MYQTTASTLLFVEISNKNSAYKAVCVYSLLFEVSRNFFRIFPSFLFMSIAGILIPAPVPSSDNTTFDTSSFYESIRRANAPPAFSIFLTYVTNEHFDEVSTINIGEITPSGSPAKSFVNLDPVTQPSGLVELKYNLPIYNFIKLNKNINIKFTYHTLSIRNMAKISKSCLNLIFLMFE